MTPPAWLTSTPIAHRGLHDVAVPENSLAAFVNAVDHGYGIELDVHLSRDRIVVVSHDADTARATGKRLVIAESTGAELQRLRLSGTDEVLPTLAQALEAVAGRTPVLIEIKPGIDGRVIGPLVMQLLEGYTGPVAVMSFDPRIVRWFAAHAPDVCRGQLGGALAAAGLPPAASWLLRRMAFNGFTKPHFIAYDVRAASERSLALWRRLLRVPLLLWTVRTPAQLALARRIGANVIFEGVDPGQQPGAISPGPRR